MPQIAHFEELSFCSGGNFKFTLNFIVDEISLNFPELIIIGKYLKITFKNRGSPCYFLSSRDQLIKNINKTHRYFKAKTDVAQNLIDNFFLTLAVRGPFHGKDFK